MATGKARAPPPVAEVGSGGPPSKRNGSPAGRSALGDGKRSVRFFARRESLRRWFEGHHATSPELWIGYYKRDSGRPGVTYAEAVEEALCFGWVDGQVRSIDAIRYANRYTPRRRGSRWSQINLAKARSLERAGRMHPAGIEAFRVGLAGPRAGYTFEEPPRRLAPAFEEEFRSDPVAFAFFQRQPPHYRRMAAFWVMSARREETRRRRFAVLVDRSRNGMRLDRMNPGTPAP